MEFSSNLTLEILDQPFLLEKRIALLYAIEKDGSINKASASVPMSYKSAWEAIQSMNNLSPEPIVTKETGGKNGGGTILTEYGKNLLKNYTILKEEQSKFIKSLSKLVDLDDLSIKTIRRISMQISARNQIQGVVDTIEQDKVNVQISLRLKSGYNIVSIITKSALESLSIKVGDDMTAIFKSSSVMISTDKLINISSRNKLKGKVVNLIKGEINSDITIDIGGDFITSIITTSSIETLNIKLGDEVTSLIKSSDVMLGK